jgi:MFS family permease
MMSGVQGGQEAPDSRLSARAWALLLVLCGAIFLEGIDVAMLNVAVPTIREDLGIEVGTAHWVISAYVLGYGGFLLLGGRCADLIGRRRVFLAGLVVYIAFSGVGGIADEGWVLITARFVTGVAAAFMTPAGLSIITTGFAAGDQRNRALVVYGATGAAGFTVGLVVGGLLTEISWRWVFFGPVLLGTALLPAAYRLIRRDPEPPRFSGSFDLAGATTGTAGLVALVYSLVHIGDPADRTRGMVALLLAAALLTAFVVVERRVSMPLVRPSLLRSRTLVRADVVALLFAGAFFGFQYVAALYLQELRGWSSGETGVAFLVMGLDLILAPILTPGLVRRYGAGWVALVGALLAAVAYALFLRVEATWDYLDMLPSLVLVGIAFALVYAPLAGAATESVPEAEQGVASALLNTSIQLGAALGLASATSLLLASGDGATTLEDYRTALLAPTVMALAATLVVASGLWRRERTLEVSASA